MVITKDKTSPTDENELNQLVLEFHRLHNSVEKFKTQFLVTGKLLMAEEIAAGNILIKIKEVIGHGKWLDWVKENIKAISERTVQRYIQVSKASGVTDLKGKTITECYLHLGMVNDSDCIGKSSEKKSQAKKPKNRAKSETKQIFCLANQLFELLNRTAISEKAVAHIEPIINWYNGQLKLRTKREEAKKIDAEFSISLAE